MTSDERAEVVQRLVRDALAQPSPTLGGLQLNSADLLEMSFALKDAVASIAKTCKTVADLKDLQSFIETHAMVSRQVDRTVRLQHDIAVGAMAQVSPRGILAAE